MIHKYFKAKVGLHALKRKIHQQEHDRFQSTETLRFPVHDLN